MRCTIDGCPNALAYNNPRLCTYHSDVERFWARVNRPSPDVCWEWTGEKNNQGYGRFAVYRGERRTRRLAHRQSMDWHLGRILASDEVVLHACDNPPCVNPAHLSVGTHRDNVRDALRKGRMDLSGLELRSVRRPVRHGTPGGAASHRGRGETPCDECRTAENAWKNAWARRRTVKRREERAALAGLIEDGAA